MRGPYYALIVYDNGQYQWEFGSYDRSDVVSEQQDYNDKGYRLKDMQVIRFETVPNQRDVEQFLNNMNMPIKHARTY